MRTFVALIALLPLAACASERAPLKCLEIGDPELDRCITSRLSMGVRSVAADCLPPAEPVQFSGSLATDFELNDFVEGQAIPADSEWPYEDGEFVELEVGGTSLERYMKSENATKLYVDFIGRKVPCAIFGEGYEVVIVDEVVSQTIIGERPSEWHR